MFKKIRRAKKEKAREKQLNELMEKISLQFTGPDIKLVKNAVSFIKIKRASKDLAVIEKAYSFSKKRHAKQKRFSGKPYFSHLIGTALILSEYDVDATTISAALLHDILEDTNAKKAELETEFGKEIADIVSALTKVELKKARDTAYLKKLLASAAEDPRILLIKLADKLHNLRTINHMPEKRKKELCLQALEFYAPLAGQFGLTEMKNEIEDICFSVLWPKEFKKLKKATAPFYAEKEKEANEAIAILKKKLSPRPFSGYSFRKERRNLYTYFLKVNEGKRLDELYGYVFIIITAASQNACYDALRTVHSTFYPMPRKFKDYIAMPSVNYKALHTSVIGPKGNPLKIYIRTRETDALEQKGIAHWMKKNQKPLALKRISEAALSDDSFSELLKGEYLEYEITVFDKKGSPLSLPKGSSIIDFAFSLQPKKASRLAGAKVHERFVPLWYILKPADRIELFFAREKQAVQDWLNFAKCYETRKMVIEIVDSAKQPVNTVLEIEAVCMETVTNCLQNALSLASVKSFSAGQKGNSVKARIELELPDTDTEKKLLSQCSKLQGVNAIQRI